MWSNSILSLEPHSTHLPPSLLHTLSFTLWEIGFLFRVGNHRNGFGLSDL